MGVTARKCDWYLFECPIISAMILGGLSFSGGISYIDSFLSSPAARRTSPVPPTRLQNLMSCSREGWIRV